MSTAPSRSPARTRVPGRGVGPRLEDPDGRRRRDGAAGPPVGAARPVAARCRRRPGADGRRRRRRPVRGVAGRPRSAPRARSGGPRSRRRVAVAGVAGLGPRRAVASSAGVDARPVAVGRPADADAPGPSRTSISPRPVADELRDRGPAASSSASRSIAAWSAARRWRSPVAVGCGRAVAGGRGRPSRHAASDLVTCRRLVAAAGAGRDPASGPGRAGCGAGRRDPGAPAAGAAGSPPRDRRPASRKRR